jgi:hypothetical protein
MSSKWNIKFRLEINHQAHKIQTAFLSSPIAVFPKLFEPRHTKLKPEISRHAYQFAFKFLSSNIALLALDELNLQLNLN